MTLPNSRALWLALSLLSFCEARADSNLNASHALAWGANVGWTNWRPDPTNGVHIGQYICSGHIYAANLGWISLGNGHPANGIQYQNNSEADFGVNHDQLGNLRGLAYGANIGWINFETNGAPRIDLRTGKLAGAVYGANVGWIHLSDGTFFLQADSIGAGEDRDNDAIADAWELIHAQNLTRLGGDNDLDQDGLTDVQEYLADTDPYDPNDRLKILEFSASPNGASTLTWNSRPTREYIIKHRLHFSPEIAWASTLSSPIPGNGQTLSATVTNSLGAVHGFFRIEAIRPLSLR